MASIWSDEGSSRRGSQVEQAATAAWAELGVVPRGRRGRIAAARRRRRSASRSSRRRSTTTPPPSSTRSRSSSDDEGRWLHYGLTSSDVVDTALSLQIREAGKLIVAGLDTAFAAVVERAEEHRATLQIGRTHGVHAEPTTFGLKLAGWAFELGRDRERVARALEGMRVGKLSGAVGTYAATDPELERIACERLGLDPAPTSTQILQRDRHAELLTALAVVASSLDAFALEIRHLARTEVAEVQEPFGRGQKGSSSMPHKRNPVVAERICGLARVVRGYALVGLENVALWHERDISHSSAERVVIPDSFLALDYMLDRFTWLV
jgi:adenylosuccinate lyase